MSPHGTSQPISNTILAGLPSELLAHLMPKLVEVEVPQRMVLYAADAPIEHAYFPQQGMVSLVKPLEDGAMVEVGMIGREGFVGMPLAIGAAADAVEAMVQIGGSGLRISADALREEMRRSPVLLSHLHHFTHAFYSQITQTAACNGRHTLNERLARWLLMASDRVGDTIIPLSHDFLSMMLASRRPGVTVALGTFKHAGIIHNTHGRIEILSRDGLEAAACECYQAVKQHYDSLLSY